MSEARLAPGIEVSALLGAARAQGGFGMVLAKGDPDRGAILVVLLEQGAPYLIVQRRLGSDAIYRWEARESSDTVSNEATIARQRRSDPDLWVIELDVPSAERFVAEMTRDA